MFDFNAILSEVSEKVAGESSKQDEKVFQTKSGKDLDHYDLLGLLKEWELQHCLVDGIWTQISEVFGTDPENQLFKVLWGTFEKYTDTLGRVLGDKYGVLDWYWHENKMGLRGHVYKIDGEEREICGLKDLVWVLEKRYGIGGNGKNRQ
jgi:hypothetical protein